MADIRERLWQIYSQDKEIQPKELAKVLDAPQSTVGRNLRLFKLRETVFNQKPKFEDGNMVGWQMKEEKE